MWTLHLTCVRARPRAQASGRQRNNAPLRAKKGPSATRTDPRRQPGAGGAAQRTAAATHSKKDHLRRVATSTPIRTPTSARTSSRGGQQGAAPTPCPHPLTLPNPQQAPLPSYPPIPAPLLRAARVRRGARGGDVKGVLPQPLPLSQPLPLPLSLTCARLEAVEMAGQRWAAEALRPAPAVQGLVG